MGDHERRRYRRVRYPEGLRPRFRCGMEYPILELSQGGVVIDRRDSILFHPGAEMQGLVIFDDDDTMVVQGHILRIRQDEVIIKMDKGIPAPRIAEERALDPGAIEQRRFFRLHYPDGMTPTFFAMDHAYAVIELSEEGFVFSGRHAELAIGQETVGVITLHDGRHFLLRGVVLRQTRIRTIVRLLRAMPSQVIFDEQRYIITRVPHVAGR